MATNDMTLQTRSDIQQGTIDRTTAVTLSPCHPVTLSPLREPVLLCQRVSKWYGPVIGVNQVTLELRPGITGLVGSNGAGKSTLMRLATGQVRASLGRVRVCGVDSWGWRAKR